MGLTVAMCVTLDAKTEFLHVVENISDLSSQQVQPGLERTYSSPVTAIRAILDYCKSFRDSDDLMVVVLTSRGRAVTHLGHVKVMAESLAMAKIQAEDNAIDDLMNRHDPFDELEAEDEHSPFYEWPESQYGGGE